MQNYNTLAAVHSVTRKGIKNRDTDTRREAAATFLPSPSAGKRKSKRQRIQIRALIYSHITSRLLTPLWDET